MTRPFVHLHVHSEYSLLDGAIRCGELAEKVASWGMPAVALTDHGTMYGAVEFYDKCLAAGIKPIIGCEVYVDPDGHTSRERKGKNFHLLLLAENQQGYDNLVKLVSIANTDGFYYKPRIDHDLLSRYSSGIIASSACIAGEIPQLILEGKEKEALSRAEMYRDIMGADNFFLEIMYNRIPEQAVINRALVEMARKNGFNLVATNDAHYLNEEDYDWHEILLCVQTNATINDQDRMSFSTNDFYLRSPEEMDRLLGGDLPDALDNTVAIAERCSVRFELGTRDYKLPSFDLPEGETLESNLEKEAWAGLKERLSTNLVPEEYSERLKYELSIIKKMGFAGYFLIVAGIIRAAKNLAIPIGPGRGSAAGSLVAYCLRITELDPLKYNLLFERFLNPERISMPDIDTDVSDKGREELLHYIVQKYGADRVSQIITFDRMKSKAAVRDVGRALGMPYGDVDKIAKLIPEGVKSIPEALEQSSDLQEVVHSDLAVKRLLDSASKIEGLARHCSQHAAGVVITPMPITDLVPVRKIGDDQIVTQYPMEPIEKLGLVKMDFLGLKTLSVLEEAVENIRLNGKPAPDLNRIPLNDSETYSMLQRGDTLGVFQLESTGMRQLLRKMKPDCFEDLIAVLALYRPGPLGSGMVDQYVERKHGRASVEYLHPALSEVLKETYGVILYQEQVMQCAAKLAGYTLGEADLLRRAMGKKKVEVMEQQRIKFVEGCAQHGVAKKKSEEIFDIIQEFAGYGFNKSHSAAYALISYQTAYLKCNYRSEFMAAYLSSQIGSKKDVMASYVREVRNSGIEVLPPDVNSSMESFTAVGEVVRFGLGAVAKAGHTAVEAILKARDSGKAFSSLWDFVCRVDLRTVNKSVIENLIKAGAFDDLSQNRHQLLEALPDFISLAQRQNEEKNQCSLLSLFDDCEDGVEVEPELPDIEEFSIYERLDMEKEVVGLYISGHPFAQYEPLVSRYCTCRISDLKYWRGRNQCPQIGGMILSVQEKYTRKGDPMGILELEDAESKVEVICFPKTWASIKGNIEAGNICIIRGTLNERGENSVIARDVVSLQEAQQNVSPYVRIVLEASLFPMDALKGFFRSLKSFPGHSPVLLEVRNGVGSAVILLDGVKVDGPSVKEKGFAPLLSEEAYKVCC